MGTINLPNVDEIESQKDPNKKMEMLVNTFGLLMKELREINGYLSGGNLKANAITAREISADAVTANQIKAGSITTEKLVVGSVSNDRLSSGAVTPDKMTVDELSAIADDLGTIIAGVIKGIQIYGSYIATSETYPRTEMDVTGNFLAAISVPGTYLSISPMGFGSVPALSLVVANALKGFLSRSAGGTSLGTFDSENLNFQAAGSIIAQALSGNINLAPSGNFQIGGVNGVTGTFYVAGTSGGSPNVPVTFTKGIRTG